MFLESFRKTLSRKARRRKRGLMKQAEILHEPRTPPASQEEDSTLNPRNSLENTARKQAGRLLHEAQDNKAKQGLGLHTPTPTPPPPPKTSLLTARTQPPSPSPAASHSNRRGEPRNAAEKKIQVESRGGFQQHPGRRGASVRRERTDALGRSDRDFFFVSSCSFSTESSTKARTT